MLQSNFHRKQYTLTKELYFPQLSNQIFDKFCCFQIQKSKVGNEVCERSSKHQKHLCLMTRPEGGALLLKCSGVQGETVDHNSCDTSDNCQSNSTLTF